MSGGVRFSDQDFLFCFLHKYIVLPVDVERYTELPNRVGIGNMQQVLKGFRQRALNHIYSRTR